jgi:hypothetical protein
MFDPSFFSFGNGLFYNPLTDSVASVASTGTIKGREYSLADYENLKYEIGNQTNILGVNHQASFSSSQDEIIDDMAKQLASYGVSSLKDLTENRYTKEIADPSYYGDGSAPMILAEEREVINSKTGEVIPLNELNNSAGKGFTWYKVEFVDGQAVPYAWKEATGAGAFFDQAKEVIRPITPVLVAMTAGALLPAATTAATAILPQGASAFAVNTTANALANAAATTAVTSAATGNIGTGLKAGGSVLASAVLNEATNLGIDAIEDATGFELRPGVTTGSNINQGLITESAPVTPSVTGGIPEVVVTAPPTSLLDTVSPVLTNLVNAPTTTTVPDVVITGTRPTETDLVAPVIPGLLDTITVTGTRPDIPTVTVTGTRPPEPDLGSILTTATNVAPSVTPVMPTSETITPTVTITGTPPTITDLISPVTSVAPPPSETPPETTPETTVTPNITLPTLMAEPEQVSRGYVPYGSVSYEPLLSLLAPQLQTLPYASAYRRGLL